MNNLITLLKYDLINSYGINKFFNRRNKKEYYKNLSIAFIIATAIGSLFYSAFMYFDLMVEPLKQMGMISIIIVQGFLISVLIILGTSIYKSPGMIFGIKDYDMLISMPIKPHIILIVKLMNLVIVNYLFMAITLLPSLILYGLNTNITFEFILYAFIMYIFIPFIPTVIASILGIIFSFFMSRVKHKNILLIITFSIFVIFSLVLSANMEGIIKFITKNAIDINDILQRIYPPIKYYLEGIIELKLSGVIKFLGVSILIFILFIFTLNRSFVSINSKLLENYKKNNFKMVKLKESSVIRALYNKEISMYFSKPMVVLNTAISMVLFIIMAFGTLFLGENFILESINLQAGKEIIPELTIVMISILIALSNTTSSTISLEGNKFWILKTLPISFTDIFKAKILLNLTITLIPLLIGIPILIISLKLSGLSCVFLIIIPILIAIYSAQVGLIINLIFPVMEWKSETIVVKQSLSVMLTMIINGGAVALPVVIAYWLKISNLQVYLISIIIILMLINIILYKVLCTYGKKRIMNI